MTPPAWAGISAALAIACWAMLVWVVRARRQVQAIARRLYDDQPIARWARTHALVIPASGDEKGVNVRLDLLRAHTDHNRQSRPQYVLPAGVRIEYRGPREEVPEPADKPLNGPLP